MPKVQKRPIVYTICIDEKPVVTFSGTSVKEALELIREDWFRAELQTKRIGGTPVWNVNARLTARSARPDEEARFTMGASSAYKDSDDLPLVYLVELD